MSNIKPIQINPELFKISNNNQKNKTLKRRPAPDIKPNALKRDLLERIKMHRANKQEDKNINNTENTNLTNNLDNNLDNNEKEKTELPISLEHDNSNKINKINKINNDDDFLQSIDFLKTLSNRKQNRLNKNDNSTSNAATFPLEKTNNNVPVYGCLKNGTLPTFRELHNKTVKKYDTNNISNTQNDEINTTNIYNAINCDNNDTNNMSNVNYKNKRNVTFKYNLGKKHKVVSVLIKNAYTRKKISNEHSKLKESKINDMKNYLKRHNLLKSGSKCPPDIIKKLYEQALLGGDIRNTNKTSMVHNFISD